MAAIPISRTEIRREGLGRSPLSKPLTLPARQAICRYSRLNSACRLRTPKLSGRPCFSKSKACTTGGIKPGDDPGWEAGVTLDLQWAHVMAPRATICVVETPSDSPTDLFAAIAVASQCVAENGGGEVSMSWGFCEGFRRNSLLTAPLHRRGSSISPLPATPWGHCIPLSLPMSSPSAALAWRAIRCRGEAAWAIFKARTCGMGTHRRYRRRPSLYEPAPLISSWSRTSSKARGALPTCRVADPSTGCGSTTRTFGLARRWWNQRFHPGMASSTRGSGRQLHAVELAEIYASGQEALEIGSDTARTGDDVREPREASSDQDETAD
jgi:hypothetical protein